MPATRRAALAECRAERGTLGLPARQTSSAAVDDLGRGSVACEHGVVVERHRVRLLEVLAELSLETRIIGGSHRERTPGDVRDGDAVAGHELTALVDVARSREHRL